MTQISFKDIELLTTYLDGQLDANKARRLESRLESDPALRAALEELTGTRALFRRMPHRRAPRNFTLTPKMAGIKPPLPRAYPALRFTSAFAAVLLFFSFALNFATPLFSAPALMASAPAAAEYGRGGGAIDAGPTIAASEPQPDAAPPSMAPLAPQSTEQPSELATPLAKMAPTPTSESMMQTEQANKAGIQSPAPERLNQPAALIVPPLWMAIFLIVAVLAGSITLIVRLLAERKWRKTNAVKNAAPIRDIFFLVIAIFLIIAAFWGITALAKGNPFITSSVSEIAVFIPTDIPPAPGQKGNLDPDGNKGGTFTSENSRFSLESGTGYNFTYSNPQGYVIALAFPGTAFDAQTEVQFSVGQGAPAPEGFIYAGRGFQFYSVPENLQLRNPVNVTVFYSDADVAHVMDENTLALLYWDGSNWINAASTCSPTSYISRSPGGNVISLDVCQSGSFALFAPQ
jgi:hypothetical protein